MKAFVPFRRFVVGCRCWFFPRHQRLTRDATRRFRGLQGLGFVLLAILAGCSTVSDIDSVYGHRKGKRGIDSVNGTGVLSGMFVEAGHRVSSWYYVSPRLENAQIVFWAPDDFRPPDAEVRDSLEQWLANRPDRTLIYVGRDFDAGPEYWRSILPRAPLTQAHEVARRGAMAQAEYDARRVRTPKNENVGWFVVRGDQPYRMARSLSGPWSQSVDGSKVQIPLRTRLEIPSRDSNSLPAAVPADSQVPAVETTQAQDSGKEFDWAFGGPFEYYQDWQDSAKWESLLASEKDVLVSRITSNVWPNGQLLVVTNGSLVLNGPLVNREHRKLARKLVAACGPPARVIFLESREGGPPISENEPTAKQPTGFEALTTWPLGAIIMHLTVLGLVACFVFFPIFGRPRSQPVYQASAGRRTDFGNHLEAVAELLENTGNVRFARQVLLTYRQKWRGQATPQSTEHQPQFPIRTP